jgi:hypothetical protein
MDDCHFTYIKKLEKKERKKKKTGLEAVFLSLTNFRPEKYDFKLYKGFFMGKKGTKFARC